MWANWQLRKFEGVNLRRQALKKLSQRVKRTGKYPWIAIQNTIQLINTFKREWAHHLLYDWAWSYANFGDDAALTPVTSWAKCDDDWLIKFQLTFSTFIYTWITVFGAVVKHLCWGSWVQIPVWKILWANCERLVNRFWHIERRALQILFIYHSIMNNWQIFLHHRLTTPWCNVYLAYRQWFLL